MNDSFDRAFDRLMGNEGGYVDDPKDSGGATRWGITERVARANGYTGSMEDLLQTTAKRIARKVYWDPYRLGELEPEVAFQAFDGIYNSGKRAVGWLQRACGAIVDDKLGDRTIAAANAAAPGVLIARFNGYRLEFLSHLDAWPSFGRGWARRIAHNLTGET